MPSPKNALKLGLAVDTPTRLKPSCPAPFRKVWSKNQNRPGLVAKTTPRSGLNLPVH